MSIDDVYALMRYAINKNQNGGYLSPSEFNNIINVAQNSFMSYLIGEFQQYQQGRPQSRISWGNNQVVRQILSPAIYGVNLTIQNDGYCAYPADYIITDAMWSIYGYQRIREVPQQNLFEVVNSAIDPIATNPCYVIEKNGFRFFPNNLGQAKLNYVQEPRQMKWGYDTIYGRPVYNPSTSVDPVWADVDLVELIVRALRIVGVNLQATDVSLYADEIKKNGQ